MIRNCMMVLGAAALTVGVTGTAACGAPTSRVLSGQVPTGGEQVVAIDTTGRAFTAASLADGSYRLDIASDLPVTIFVSDNGLTRVLRMPSTVGAAPDVTTLPAWQGEVSTAQLSTCDCNTDGADEEVEAENNPLEQIDTDGDGASDLDDDDDDGDGIDDDDDDEADGSGEDDDNENLDTDNDGRPDLCDDDDDGDGILDDDDEDERGDHDGDGIDDDQDSDDDNDGLDDDDDDDDDDDGVDDDDEADDSDSPEDAG